jgi:hypothetical protein
MLSLPIVHDPVNRRLKGNKNWLKASWALMAGHRNFNFRHIVSTLPGDLNVKSIPAMHFGVF